MIEEPQSPHGRRSRLEDEVLEILHRSDRPPTFTERLRARRRSVVRGVQHHRSSARFDLGSLFDSGAWFLAFVSLGVVAYLVGDASPLLARILALACVALLAIAIVRSLARPNRGAVKRWRGRDIDISPMSRPLWIDRVFRGQRRPPRR
jgi:hypothetical protein